MTPLHVASFMGCMNIVIYLIQNGANADVTTVRGETPLHLAARANQTDIVRVLLRNNATVDAKARVIISILYCTLIIIQHGTVLHHLPFCALPRSSLTHTLQHL